jgi:hypothetical protein
MKEEENKKTELIENIIDQVVGDVSGKEQEYIYRFANVKEYIPSMAKGLDYCLSIGLKLNEEIIDGIAEGPDKKYLEHYNIINQELKEIAYRIKVYIEENLGHRAIAFLPSTPEEVKKLLNFKES